MATTHRPMSESLPPELDDALSTTILVYRVIVDAESALTYDDIVARTNLSRRAVRDKTSKLVTKDLIEPCWRPPNQRAFRNCGGGVGGTECHQNGG